MEFINSPKNTTFLNTDENYTNADFIILGIPLDMTSTFRAGSKDAPDSIRLASQDLESYDIFYGLDVEDCKICDLGDIDLVHNDLFKNFNVISEVSDKISKDNKVLIALGGEHSITYPLVKSFDSDLIIHFDAHGDMRDEYLGEKWTHASVIKRILDEKKGIKVINFGLRALGKQEIINVEKYTSFSYFDTYQIEKGPLHKLNDEFLDLVKSYNKIHVTFDLDVLDLSACPGVCNPEPGGLSYLTAKNLLSMTLSPLKNKITSFDVVELNPNYDAISSPFVAAKIVFDFLAIMTEN